MTAGLHWEQLRYPFRGMSTVACWCISMENSLRGDSILAGTFPRDLLGEMQPLRPNVPSGLLQLQPGSQFVHRERDAACLPVFKCANTHTHVINHAHTVKEHVNILSYENTHALCRNTDVSMGRENAPSYCVWRSAFLSVHTVVLSTRHPSQVRTHFRRSGFQFHVLVVFCRRWLNIRSFLHVSGKKMIP